MTNEERERIGAAASACWNDLVDTHRDGEAVILRHMTDLVKPLYVQIDALYAQIYALNAQIHADNETILANNRFFTEKVGQFAATIEHMQDKIHDTDALVAQTREEVRKLIVKSNA